MFWFGMQEGFVAEDDISASDNYDREVDEEAEFKRAQEAALAENAKRMSEHASTSSSSEAPVSAAANGHAEAGDARHNSSQGLSKGVAVQQV